MADHARLSPNQGFLRLLGRYGIVGMFNTAFSYGVYCLLIFAGLGFVLATLIATVAGICLSFVTLGKLVFMRQLSGRFLRFAGVWAALYLVNIALIWIGVSMGASEYLAGLLASIPIIGISFLLQRYFVFR